MPQIFYLFKCFWTFEHNLFSQLTKSHGFCKLLHRYNTCNKIPQYFVQFFSYLIKKPFWIFVKINLAVSAISCIKLLRKSQILQFAH